jgi:hypothetical protein
MLVYADQIISEASDLHLLWCNARLPAVGFYEKQGWITISDTFEIPTAGPHRKMKKEIRAK